MSFDNGMDQNLAKYWYPNEKMVVVPVILMVDVILQGAWVLYDINKDERDESLPLRAFRRRAVNAIFLKTSKEGKLSSSHLGIRDIPSDVCYDDTKHQMQSEYKRIQTPSNI